MQNQLSSQIIKEPYRIFFPLGIIFLLWGSLIWLPQIWAPGDYPVLAHRYLMLNGFVASFIGGFLMTAVPKFSKTNTAEVYEVLLFGGTLISGLIFAYKDHEIAVAYLSSVQALIILAFLFTRIFRRQENPPYSFIFIFVGLFLWLISGPSGILGLHYEGSIAAIILGVGSRLIPGILGHVEIVSAQRAMYERPVSIFKTIPPFFALLVVCFMGSYFLSETMGAILRAGVVFIIGMKYWLLWKRPKTRTALTWNIWISAWLIVLSFILRAAWEDGMIHAGHSFFINGIVLLSLLIATRVLVSHGPKRPELENSRTLYILTGFLLLAASTRVTAFLMPQHYLSHLGYSALILVLGVLIWALKYLRFIRSI